MKDKINAWLQNPDKNFAQGVQYYHQFKITSKFDNFFNVMNPARNSMQFKMLITELINIHRKLKAKADKEPAEKKHTKDDLEAKPLDLRKKAESQKLNNSKIKPVITDNPVVDISLLPEDLQMTYFDNKKLFAQITNLHTNLKHVTTDDERKEIMEEINQTEMVHKENWAKIDDWWIHRNDKNQEATKEEKESGGNTILKLVQRRNNLRTNISRTQKDLPEMTDKFRKKNEVRLAAWKHELEGIMEKLKKLEENGNIPE